MSAMPAENHRNAPKGHRPRIAPPIPARHELAAFKQTAEAMGITLMPAQELCAKYLTARGPDGLLYREVCIVMARQNGKTTLGMPLIIRDLRAGRKVLHIANTRELPRQMFGFVAEGLSKEPELFPKRRGRTIWPRYGAGQEEIRTLTGGVYRIAAANTGAARGGTYDRVIIDELREMTDDRVVGEAEPTLTMSAEPQMVYFSNAGTDESVILNALRERANNDPSLAYLEWSAKPDRTADDVEGWAEANPAMGIYPSVQRTLEAAYRKHRLGGTLAIFETEHLCRWVKTTREALVDGYAWMQCGADRLGKPTQPVLAVSMDPDGRRASAAMAWREGDGVALRLLFNVTGNPIDTDRLGEDIRTVASAKGIRTVGFDPLTDAALARYFKKPEPISGQKFANATATFVNIIAAGKLAWQDADAVTDDLTWTAKKHDRESGSYEAVRASDDHPITASLAAIRAVWLASVPPTIKAKVM